ncbi:MAG: TIM barrel protein [Dehalococcoidia bacterium]
MKNNFGTKRPISLQAKAGERLIKQFEFGSESSLADVENLDSLKNLKYLLTSAHAPQDLGELRLNIASEEDDYRDFSISTMNNFIDSISDFPNVRKINMHFPPKRWQKITQTKGRVGNYSIMIDSIIKIASYAAKHDILLVLENLNSYWWDNQLSDGVDLNEVDWETKDEAFGMSPEEWIKICEDVSSDNVKLCLDSSHVCTYAHRFPPEQREERVMSFLKKSELIDHVHWSDNYLFDLRGRRDSHLLVGDGSLPLQFHKKIKNLDATLLLEHYYDEAGLLKELDYIKKL